MKTMQDWFDAYGVSHKNHTNKTIHWICVPLIFYSIVGILSLVSLDFIKGWLPIGIQPFIHLGTILVLFGVLFFLRLSVPIAMGMLIISVIILLFVNQTYAAFGEMTWVFFVSV